MRFLVEIVLAAARLLSETDRRLFATPMDATRAATPRDDADTSERVDAFVPRFGRLQDTLGDKRLSRLLQWLAEPLGPAIDDIAKAERLGLIGSG